MEGSRQMIERLMFLCGLRFWSWLLIVLSLIWWVTVIGLLRWTKQAGEKMARGEKVFK